MAILTKGMMGAIAAASVVATAPAYAGMATAAPAQGYHKSEATADFYKRKHHDRR